MSDVFFLFGAEYRVRTEKPDVCVRCIAWIAALVFNVSLKQPPP